ncbi:MULTISPECIES: DUF5009 domain-containing protein [unclassified Janthinobacterium]|uniref:DUF5009 domain-containing protein n=1 Tax=unclassified Janthinobacterium TaxID=2610881 RepID=UPI001613E862|nr:MULTISPECIES: DUF5009 domain-containing protein [unclassified Janthinobacterium]MBB5606871.1 putative acyltransferase [Janthinobacterium sp. S3T4]MBB5612079.1 putative acyltransferase [Janthinobacterium sp. S3M3]
MPPTTAATTQERLISLDAFRGFVILAMIWVNYLGGMPDIPYWLEHAGPRADGITLPDLVFPGFLFMVGMAIPLALQRHCGQVTPALLGRLLWRSASLMLAGVVLVNAYRYDAAASLLPRAPYYLLFYVAMILLWRQGSGRWELAAGGALMLFLLATFRGQLNDEFNSTWLQPSWWGILGMIGWSYLLCSLIYLACHGKGTALMGAFAGLIVLYMGGTAGSLDFLPAGISKLVNVPQLLGSTAANVMAGTLVGRLFLRDAALSNKQRMVFMAWFAAGLFAAGLLLRPYHQINKIFATESYTLVCSGIVLAMFLLFYIVIDIWRWRAWAALLLPAGANALFAYIAPDLWEQLAATLHLPRFWWPWWETGGAAGLLNAAVVTALMLLLTVLASRYRLKLKF